MERDVSEFLDPGLIMKPYPSCKASHNGIDAVRLLREEYGLRPEDVMHVRAEVQPYVMDLLRYTVARTKLQGKFSLHYCMTRILQKGSLTLEDFDGDTIDDPETIALMERMEVVPNDQMNNGETMLVRGDTIVTIRTTDGRELQKRVNYATGDPHCPLSEEQRMRKLRDCLARNLKENCVEEALQTLETIETLPALSDLAELLRGAAREVD
jgi:2-methylcitrate dehydratase PrpD